MNKKNTQLLRSGCIVFDLGETDYPIEINNFLTWEVKNRVTRKTLNRWLKNNLITLVHSGPGLERRYMLNL